MGRTADYSKEACPVAGTLSVVGDPWTLLILREAFNGVRRFDAWQERLGVARNVLAARLRSLVEHGVLAPRLYSQRPPRRDYVLTAKGRDLQPVLLALKAWGDRHVYGDAQRPLQLFHACGAELEPALVCKACGEPVTGRDLTSRFHVAETVGERLAAGRASKATST